MVSLNNSNHISHRDTGTAYHIDWDFRAESVVWQHGRPRVPNLYPVATNLAKWMKNEEELRFLPNTLNTAINAPTNPYSYQSSFLAFAVAEIINDAHAFANGVDENAAFDHEMRFLRYRSEFVLYSARLCEALIKQLLFCTDFRPKDYKRAAIGALLTSQCSGCKSSENKSHKLSLLGSLAHRYELCGSYENCLHERLEIANRERNSTSAHSGTIPYQDLTKESSKSALNDEILRLGEELLHLLHHIGEIEDKMRDELHDLIDAENRRLNAEGLKLIRELNARGGYSTQD